MLRAVSSVERPRPVGGELHFAFELVPVSGQRAEVRADMPLSHRDSVDGAFLLDVRNPPELAVEHVTGAVTCPHI
jgi:hypothetical protein